MRKHLMAWLVIVMGMSALAQPSNPPGKQRGTPPSPKVPEGVKAHRDLVYVENGHERHKLDLYIPQSGEEPRPLIIWVHGGGWQNGSKDSCPPLRDGYTERGYAVASINYRLSGHATFPAQIEDCKAALRWLRANASKYNLDPQRFGVWGGSAGGHLVALLGTSGEVKEFDKGANLGQSSRVQAVCDYFGPTDFVTFVTTPRYESHAKPDSPEAKLLGGAVLDNRDKAARVNPITYVTKDDPAFLIVHGDKDGTVPINQSQLLFEALKKNGTHVHFHTIQGAGHGGAAFSAPEIKAQVESFFNRFLKEKSKDSIKPQATTSESIVAEAKSAPGAPNLQTPKGIPAQSGRPTFEQILARDDRNKDGRLSKEEFRGPPALFQRLDGDANGLVDKDEHDAFLKGARPGSSDGKSKRNDAPANKTDARAPEMKPGAVKDFKLDGQQWTCLVDGEPLAGILVRPEGKGPFPALLISHGLGSNARQFGLSKARDFAKRGFVCIATDYTHAQPRGDRNLFGASDENLRRAKACLSILKSLPEVDGSRIAAYGNSMGAFLTIRLAADAADVLRACAITAGGIASEEGYPAPSTARAEKIKVPLLILHGSTDTVVRPQQSQDLKKVLDEAKTPSERHVFEGIGHDLHVTKAVEVNDLIRNWFEKHGVLAGKQVQ